jgi:hypothetical protein
MTALLLLIRDHRKCIMAYYHVSVLLLLTTCFLFIYGISVADTTDNAYSKSLILSKLPAKRLPCEIRDPFTGEYKISGPRSPFYSNLNAQDKFSYNITTSFLFVIFIYS